MLILPSSLAAGGLFPACFLVLGSFVLSMLPNKHGVVLSLAVPARRSPHGNKMHCVHPASAISGIVCS